MIFTNSDKDFQQDEQGIVAIVVTMIIMIILTLIVTGFAQLARREQRATLDRQLASQAFYAAESGINDARRALEDPDFSGPLRGQKDSCDPLASAANVDSLVDKNIGLNISYPCLLINTKLKNSIVDLSTDTSNIQNLQSYSSAAGNPAAPLNQLQVSWKDIDFNVKSVNTDALLPAASGWNRNIGMIRMDIIPYSVPFSAASLQSAMFTIFLRPSSSGGKASVEYLDSTAQGKVVNAQCDTSAGVCKIKITGLTGANNIVRMKSIYRSSTVVLCADMCNGNTVFIGNQVEVDSTGKAGDVLKRLKVRIPKKPGSGTTDIPEFTLDSSAGICKKIEVTPTSFSDTCLPY